MFVGNFNSKLEAFGCAKKNISGPKLKNIQSRLNLTYLNTNEHTHLDKRTGNTDILDMAFVSPNLTKHHIQISTDAQPHRNLHTNPIRYNAGINLTGYHPSPGHPGAFAPKCVSSPRAFAQQKMPGSRANKWRCPWGRAFASTWRLLTQSSGLKN